MKTGLFTCYNVAESFFLQSFSVTNNSILFDLSWSYLDECFKVDNCLSSIFKPISAAKRRVFELFCQ